MHFLPKMSETLQISHNVVDGQWEQISTVLVSIQKEQSHTLVSNFSVCWEPFQKESYMYLKKCLILFQKLIGNHVFLMRLFLFFVCPAVLFSSWLPNMSNFDVCDLVWALLIENRNRKANLMINWKTSSFWLFRSGKLLVWNYISNVLAEYGTLWPGLKVQQKVGYFRRMRCTEAKKRLVTGGKLTIQFYFSQKKNGSEKSL